MLPVSDRQKAILFTIIRSFVADGAPVSSGAVAASPMVDVSSATIRNVMAELEVLGLVRQPHTSAGRIPTPAGLRIFVDSLASSGGDGLGSMSEIERAMLLGSMSAGGASVEQTARQTGVLMSQFASLASIVSLPAMRMAKLVDLHLSMLGDGRVLAMVITDDGQLVHRIVKLEDRAPTGGQLVRMQNYLSALVEGLTLEQVRQRVRVELEMAERAYNDVLRTALEIGSRAVEAIPPQIYIEGTLNFLEYAELTEDVTRLKELLEAVQERELMMELVEHLWESTSPAVFIGPEMPGPFEELSVIICGYKRGGEQVGVLGLMGPTRMDYERAITLVGQTALLLSRALDQSQTS
ncbi:MAG: heat-inducible transcriptional repressor HrcA [Myxococcota bacterium]